MIRDARAQQFSVAYFWTVAVVVLILMPSASYALEEANHPRLILKAAVDTALRNNPGLARMKARYKAMEQMPDQMGALPDPMLSFGAMNLPTNSFDRDQEGMTQLQIGFSQMFPFPGKLGLRKEAAEFEAKAASYSVDEMRLKLKNGVANKWWQLFYLNHALDTVDSNQTLLRQFVEVAKTKYKTGKGLQQDVLLSQLELSKLIDKKILIESMRRHQAIQLNLLMDLEPGTVILLPDKVSKSMPSILDEQVLYQIAKRSRPRLKEVAQSVAAAESRLKLAKRNYYPDFKLSVAYGDRVGDNPMPMGGKRDDLLSLMVGIQIPLYAASKQSKAVKQRSSDYQKQQYALQDEKNRVMADIASAVTDYRRAQEQLSLFEDGIVPQARQTVQSMLAGYQVSEVDFLNLVRSQVTLFNYELQYWKALTSAKQALSRLQAAAGEESIYE